MRQLILFFVGSVMSFSAYGQDILGNLVKIGIEFHDKGEYESAIEIYKKALIIDPNSEFANYEIAMTYMYTEDFESCVKHSDKVISKDGEYVLPAYVTKGSCLDYLGRTNESIALFKKGLKKFGDHYLIYYNLGYNYCKINESEEAEEALTNAIHCNASHASSHLLMGYLMTDLHNKSRSLMSLYYFLMLEPDSDRARQAYELLQKQYGSQVEGDQENPDQVNIFLDPEIDSEFGPADMMVSMLEAVRTSDRQEGKSEEKIFLENTRSFFTILGEMKKKKCRGVWWDFYVPFFYDLAISEHLETYCHYISQTTSEFSKNWIENHEEAVNQFNNWIRGYQKNL
jgi:tetratricopeptide (TPR) repeat protein